MPLSMRQEAAFESDSAPAVASASAAKPKREPIARPTPLSPRRYKLQVTIGETTRGKLQELQALLSHQIPNGDPAEILDRALDALLVQARKKKAALTDRPRATREKKKRNRGIPASVRREVFERDEGCCTFVDARGRRCGSKWRIEFHHVAPYSRGGTHDLNNITLRCRAHNQYEAELDFGAPFMESRRTGARASP